MGTDQLLIIFNRWMLGYCMPPEVLGPLGYITINQSNLKSLSLVVDGACRANGLEGLAHLKNLRHFSWRGVVAKRNFHLFRKVVEHNAHHLVSLDVEVVRHYNQRLVADIQMDLIWLGLLIPPIRFRGNLEKLSTEPITNEFQLKSLVSLSLRNVSLLAWGPGDELTFDPAKLTVLRLDYCPKTLRFFETWETRDHGFSLRSFGGIIDENWGRRAYFPLEDLLDKYDSQLEELYLSINVNLGVEIDFDAYWPELKRLVLSFFSQGLGVRTESSLPDRFVVRLILRALPGLEGFAFSRSPSLIVS